MVQLGENFTLTRGSGNNRMSIDNPRIQTLKSLMNKTTARTPITATEEMRTLAERGVISNNDSKYLQKLINYGTDYKNEIDDLVNNRKITKEDASSLKKRIQQMIKTKYKEAIIDKSRSAGKTTENTAKNVVETTFTDVTPKKHVRPDAKAATKAAKGTVLGKIAFIGTCITVAFLGLKAMLSKPKENKDNIS